jgi:hypothetical protein
MAGSREPNGYRERVVSGMLAVLVMACLLSLAACQADGEQAARDEFKAYWSEVHAVIKRQNAQTDNAEKKADRTDGALNAYGAYCAAMASCYERAADGYAAIKPPSTLAGVHKDLVRETRKAARVMDDVGDEIRAEIRDSDLTEFSQSWIDKQTGPSGKAMDRQIKAYKAWRKAAIAEGTSLGLEFTN